MIGCAGGCGLAVLAESIESSGWARLDITGRYRCGACERALHLASTTPGAPSRDEPDTLPPASRGALKALPEAAPLKESVK